MAETKLKIGEETEYRGYIITHEDKREFTVSIAFSSLKAVKKWIDYLIERDLLKSE